MKTSVENEFRTVFILKFLKLSNCRAKWDNIASSCHNNALGHITSAILHIVLLQLKLRSPRLERSNFNNLLHCISAELFMKKIWDWNFRKSLFPSQFYKKSSKFFCSSWLYFGFFCYLRYQDSKKNFRLVFRCETTIRVGSILWYIRTSMDIWFPFKDISLHKSWLCFRYT